MILEHKKNKIIATMSLYNYQYTLRYGVIETGKNGLINSWNEKPNFSTKINMGCYVFEPEIFSYIPKNKEYHMTNVIKKIISKRKHVGSFISKKPFIDIGDKEVYEKTNRMYSKNNKKK